MMKSQIEFALQQLNQEIHMIVRSVQQNDTSYFPDAQKVLESFENYLNSSQIQTKDQGLKNYACGQFFVFQENISSKILLKHQRFLKLIQEWDFIFKNSFKQIFSNSNQSMISHHFLPQINMTEAIFLMYLCLEVERKEIIGQIKHQDSKNMFLLQQIIKILDEFYNNEKRKSYKSREMNEKCSFSINQDRFVKILFLKALKIKLQKQNFSFTPKIFGSENSTYFEKSGNVKQRIENISKVMNKNLDENFSIISVQSEYNPSIINQKNHEKLRQSMSLLESKLYEDDFKLEMKNLSSEEIFQYISLNELKGYISEQ